MTPTSWIKNAARKIYNFGEPKSSEVLNNIGWHTVGTLEQYYKNDYENSYPSIRVLSQSFAAIEPYTIDARGNQVASNVLDRLYTPNRQMSGFDFREGLAVMTAVHNKVYIRVHHRTTKITADTITGFTFLEGVREHIVDGQMEYWLPNGEKLTDESVVTLKNINPYSLNKGFSMAFAARRWTSLDDYIADYQAGFFKNGAVPAGQFIITARTGREFKDIVEAIKENHRGAGNNNSVMYAHRPTDANGKPLDSQVEWQPFSASNKDMALKDLFEQANKKIDSTYGVPASLRAVNDNNTYASVRVDEQLFMKYTLTPFASKIWSRFNHELTRITGGMGLAISCSIEIPTVADEEKVRAESKQVDAQTVINLVQAGYKTESAIKYIQTDDISVLVKEPKPIEKPDVLSSEEADETPEQPIDPARNNSKKLGTEARDTFEKQLAKVIYNRMNEQIQRALPLASSKVISADKPVDEVDNELLADEMYGVISAVLTFQGQVEHPLNIALVREAGIPADNVSPFAVTGAEKAWYKKYLQGIATGYNEQTADRIRNALEVGFNNGQSANQIREALKGILDEQWRIDRLAITEVNLAGNKASLFSMQNIAKETGAKVRKTWRHNSNGGDVPCAYCSTLIGTTIELDDNFLGFGDSMTADGGVMTNTWHDIDTGGLHAHCHCNQTYEVVA